MKKEETTFLSREHAMDEKAKIEKLLNFLKIPFIASIPATIFIYLAFATEPASEIVGNIFAVLGFVGLVINLATWIVTLIKGGAKYVGKMIVNILFFGFIFVPFPANLLVGFICVVVALYFLMFIPSVILLLVMLKLRKQLKAANQYIQYAHDDEF